MKPFLLAGVLLCAAGAPAWARDERPGSAAATGQYLPLGVLNNLNGIGSFSGGAPRAAPAGAPHSAPAAPETSDQILHRMFVTGDGTSHLQTRAARPLDR